MLLCSRVLLEQHSIGNATAMVVPFGWCDHPGFPPEEVDIHRILAHLPHPPKRPAARPIPPTPVISEPRPRSAFHHHGIPQLPKPPDRRPWTPFLRASLAHIQHAFPAFYRDLDWPSDAVQGADGLGLPQGWGHGCQDEDPPGPPQRRGLRSEE